MTRLLWWLLQSAERRDGRLIGLPRKARWKMTTSLPRREHRQDEEEEEEEEERCLERKLLVAAEMSAKG